ncbi:MAG: hypothetical protein PHQ62_00870 [Clostridia bacterium]|nr:hypothetical protein [Clostridia bacterium]
MNKKEIAWGKTQIYDLFKLVENFRTTNKPLLKAFESFALISNRKPNSIRNFYYYQLKIFEKNKNLAKDFNINLDLHKKNEQKFFTAQEVKLSMGKINELLSKGYSVRRACQEVAGGSLQLMIRLQNKYRSELKQKTTAKKNNVLFMPNKKSGLTDDEINSLFLGLVKIVKKSARDNLDANLIFQVQSANNELRKSIKNLADKEREVKILRKKFELLSNEKLKLKEEIKCLRSQNVEMLKAEQYPVKFNNLKSYLNQLDKKRAKKESN